MEVLIAVGILLIVLIIAYIRALASAKEQRRRFVNSLYSNYGKEKDLSDYKIPERYWNLGKYFEKHRDDYYIDDITWNDLELDRVFHKVNYTHSSCGEEYLYYRLRCPDCKMGEHALLGNQEEALAFLRDNQDARVQIELAFADIGYTGKYSLYHYLEFLETLGVRKNAKHIVPLFFYPIGIALCFYSAGIGVMLLILSMIYMIFSYMKEKGENEPYHVSFAFIVRLIRSGAGVRALIQDKPVFDEVSAKMKEALHRTAPLKMYQAFSRKRVMAGDPLSLVTDYIKMITHYDLIAFNQMLLETRKHTEEIDALYTCMGYVEYLALITNLRKALPNACVPTFHAKGTGICASDLFHPLIPGAVACSFSEKRPILITGSNASGKSTFLRETGIAAVMAQSLYTVCASAYETEYFRIYSSMSIVDDLEAGDSYYMAEIRALKRILTQLQREEDMPRILCFVDEVLRGTNTVERIAASTQILKYFADQNAMCVAATHDIELTSLLSEIYSNYHFDEEVSEGDIFFSYRLKEGKATSRNAIKLLEIMGYNQRIVESAQESSQRFMQSGVWELV